METGFFLALIVKAILLADHRIAPPAGSVTSADVRDIRVIHAIIILLQADRLSNGKTPGSCAAGGRSLKMLLTGLGHSYG